MPRIELSTDGTDDLDFIRCITRLMTGNVLVHRPLGIQIFKIDNWFDHKWLRFSGKTLGALGCWMKRLTLPPFVANRIVDQWQYVCDEITGSYQLSGRGPNIHHQGHAGDNLHRSVQRIMPTSALFWYSGITKAAGRGSLMGYIPVEDDHWPWFLAFARTTDWRIARRKNIHEYEVRLFHEAAESE